MVVCPSLRVMSAPARGTPRGGGALPGARRPRTAGPDSGCHGVDSPASAADVAKGRYTPDYNTLRAVLRGPARLRTTRQKRDSRRRGAAVGDAAGGWRPLRSRAISPLRGTREGSHPGGWGLCRRGPPGRCAGVNTGVPGPAQSTAQRRSKPRSAPRPRGEGSGTRRGRGAGLTACGKTHAAFGRRCIPPEPLRFAPFFVAFRSKYTRYSSLTRLVGRAPRPHRENWPTSALT